MRTAQLVGDLSLLRQGIDVYVGFGVRSLIAMGDVVDLLEKSVYEPRSLLRTPTGASFTLRNPPLRMGAFSSVDLRWNGTLIDRRRGSVTLPGGSGRTLDTIDRSAPLTLPVGEPTRFEIDVDRPASGSHRVRLELHSVAIPPMVWFEFSDELRDPGSIW